MTRAGRPLKEEVSSGLVELTFHGHSVDVRQLWPGQKVWKSDDPALTRRLRKSFTTSEIEGRALSVEIHVDRSGGSTFAVERARRGPGGVRVPQRRSAGRGHETSADRGDAREAIGSPGRYRLRPPAAHGIDRGRTDGSVECPGTTATRHGAKARRGARSGHAAGVQAERGASPAAAATARFSARPRNRPRHNCSCCVDRCTNCRPSWSSTCHWSTSISRTFATIARPWR